MSLEKGLALMELDPPEIGFINYPLDINGLWYARIYEINPTYGVDGKIRPHFFDFSMRCDKECRQGMRGNGYCLYVNRASVDYSITPSYTIDVYPMGYKSMDWALKHGEFWIRRSIKWHQGDFKKRVNEICEKHKEPVTHNGGKYYE